MGAGKVESFGLTVSLLRLGQGVIYFRWFTFMVIFHELAGVACESVSRKDRTVATTYLPPLGAIHASAKAFGLG